MVDQKPVKSERHDMDNAYKIMLKMSIGLFLL